MSKGHPGDVEGHLHIGDQVIPPYQGGGATEEKPKAGELPSGGFSVTDSAESAALHSGLRSADAIDRAGVPRVGNVIKITTDQDVRSLPPEVMSQLQVQLARAGLMPESYRPTGDLDTATKKALLELKQSSSTSGMSDMATLRSRIEQRAQAAAGVYGDEFADSSAGGSSGGAVSQKRTEIRTDISEPVLTDPVTARAILRDTLAERLGRAPDADEYHRFRKLLSNSEGGQDVSTTTSKYGRRGNLKSSVTTRSDDTTDPSASDLADEFSRRGKLGREANTHMVATDYYDVVQNLMGG